MGRNKKKKVKMTFEVVVPFDDMIDEDSLIKDFKGDIHKLAKYLYKNEGNFWDEKMKLVKTELLK